MITEQKVEHLFETFWDKYEEVRLSAHDVSLYHLFLYFMIENNSTSFEVGFVDIKRYLRASNQKIRSSIVSLNKRGLLTYKAVSKDLFNINICDG